MFIVLGIVVAAVVDTQAHFGHGASPHHVMVIRGIVFAVAVGIGAIAQSVWRRHHEARVVERVSKRAAAASKRRQSSYR